MQDYQVVKTFKCDGEDMTIIKMKETGSCCTMTYQEYERLRNGEEYYRLKQLLKAI